MTFPPKHPQGCLGGVCPEPTHKIPDRLVNYNNFNTTVYLEHEHPGPSLQLKNEICLVDDAVYFLPRDFMNLHRQSTKVVLPIAKGFKILEIFEIQFCKADGVYTEIWFVDGKKIVVAKILKHFEQILKAFGIIRVHDSYHVNLRYIDQYLSGNIGKLLLASGVEIDISRRRKKEFLELFKRIE